MKSRINLDGYKIKDHYQNLDKAEINIPTEELLYDLNLPRKMQANLMATAVDKAHCICCKNPHYNDMAKRMHNAGEYIENCGNFLAIGEINMPELGTMTYLKLNACDCHQFLICPRCQWLRMKKIGIKTYKMVKMLGEGYRYYLMTLTIPNCGLEYSSLMLAVDILKSALTRLKRRKIWKCVAGDITCLEIVPMEQGQGDGWHPHLHIVIAIPEDRTDIDESALMEQWPACVNAELKKREIKDKDGKPLVYPRLQTHIAELRHTDRRDYKGKNNIYTETRALKTRDGGRQTAGLRAKLGEQREDIALIVARAVMYAIKPNDRLLFPNKLKHYGDISGQSIVEWCNSYDDMPEEKSPSMFAEDAYDLDRTAIYIIHFMKAMKGRNFIQFSGIFKNRKKEIEEQDKEYKKWLKEQIKEEKDKFLFTWNGKCYIGVRYEKATPQQQQKLFSNKVTDTMLTELPEAVKARLNADTKGEIEGQLPLSLALTNIEEALKTPPTATIETEIQLVKKTENMPTADGQTAETAFGSILNRYAGVRMLPLKESPPKSERYGDYEQYCLF